MDFNEKLTHFQNDWRALHPTDDNVFSFCLLDNSCWLYKRDPVTSKVAYYAEGETFEEALNNACEKLCKEAEGVAHEKRNIARQTKTLSENMHKRYGFTLE